jgi:hypothetical protein
MLKTIFALFMLAVVSLQSHAFASSSNSCPQVQSTYSKAASNKNVLAKDHPHFPVLKEHGKLYFNFTGVTGAVREQQAGASLTGTWQAFVITPDKRTFKGPVFDASFPPPENFQILVKPPILYGTYTVCVKNISVLNDGSTFVGAFIDPDILVTDSFNQKIAGFFMQSAEDQFGQNGNPQNNPVQSTIQGFFIPTFTEINK